MSETIRSRLNELMRKQLKELEVARENGTDGQEDEMDVDEEDGGNAATSGSGTGKGKEKEKGNAGLKKGRLIG